MSNLISRSALLEKLEEHIEYEDYDYYHEEPFINLSWEMVEDIVGTVPTVEAIPKEKLQEIVERLEEDSKHWYKKKKEALKNRELEEANRYDAFEIADNHLINFVKEVGGIDG